MTTEISHQTDAASASRQDAAWSRMEEVVRQASAPAAPQARAPQPAEATGRGRRHRRRRTGVVVALVLLVAMAAGGVLVARARQRPAPAAASAPAPTTATAADVARLRAATADVLAAQAAERAELVSLAGIPTPTTVAPITNGYAASLRLYQEVLAATPAPLRAKAAVAAARQRVGTDAVQLRGVVALPPVLLGAFLEDTTARATRLQGVLRTLEHDLASRSAR
jgi:hypothetical protein